MSCPQCGQEQFCPCSTCAGREPDKLPKWKHVSDSDIACGKCGLTLNANEWLDIAWEEYEKNKTS